MKFPFSVVLEMLSLLRIFIMVEMSGSLVYRDNGHTKDYRQFGKIVNTLKNRRGLWIM
ncbi:hypothetical protein SAMN05660368_03163 [Marvinbryantia formatexigens]|nr:hypothetical protein SAMN05660368_03163 [Marvinbryantia formatexigens]